VGAGGLGVDDVAPGHQPLDPSHTVRRAEAIDEMGRPGREEGVDLVDAVSAHRDGPLDGGRGAAAAAAPAVEHGVLALPLRGWAEAVPHVGVLGGDARRDPLAAADQDGSAAVRTARAWRLVGPDVQPGGRRRDGAQDGPLESPTRTDVREVERPAAEGVYYQKRYYVRMIKRTTIEIDQELLARARRALGGTTTRWTVEEALRRAAEAAEDEAARRAAAQRRYLRTLGDHLDLGVLASEAMWR
jgi:Arc/MetJ family transcription regulator